MNFENLTRATEDEIKNAAFGGESKKHEPGAYGIVITDVVENTPNTVNINYDVIDDGKQIHYEWTHEFNLFTTSKFQGATQFEIFVTQLENVNKNFNLDTFKQNKNLNALIGLYCGVLFGEYKTFNAETGEEHTYCRYTCPLTVEQVKHKDYTMPNPVFSKDYEKNKKQFEESKKAQESAPAYSAPTITQEPNMAYDDIPF